MLSIFGGRSRKAQGGAMRISAAPVGVPLRVSSISVTDPLRSDRLAALGLVVDCEIVLRQRSPAFVIDVGETTLALDRAIADEITVVEA